MSTVFSDHNAIRLDINYERKKKTVKKYEHNEIKEYVSVQD